MPPARLHTFTTQLQAYTLDSQDSAPYKRDNWNHLLRTPQEIQTFDETFCDGMNRRKIVNLASEQLTLPQGPRLVFLSVMIWGYAGDGRGPWRTGKMLADERLDKALASTIVHLREGQIGDAYASFTVAQCGPAFFTKFFYFIGAALELNPLPLILDSRVSKSLYRLGREEHLHENRYAMTCDGYQHYIQDVNQWARELGCRPDAIELLLFDPSYAFWLWRHPSPEPVTQRDLV